MTLHAIFSVFTIFVGYFLKAWQYVTAHLVPWEEKSGLDLKNNFKKRLEISVHYFASTGTPSKYKK